MPFVRRGRIITKQRTLGPPRPLTKEDLALLTEKRDTDSKPVVQRFRDSHHMVARLFAMGLRPSQISQRVGYSINRLATFQKNPAFDALVQHYRELVNEAYKEEADSFMEMATSNMRKAERILADRLDASEDEDGDQLSVPQLVAITSDRMDRFGYGKHSTNLNVNVDFASRLEKARARSMKVIASSGAGTNTPTQPVLEAPRALVPNPIAPPSVGTPLLRRRA